MFALGLLRRAIGGGANVTAPLALGRLNSPEDVLRAYMRLAEALRRGEITTREFDAADHVLAAWAPAQPSLPNVRSQPAAPLAGLAFNRGH